MSAKGVRIPFSEDEKVKLNVSQVWQTPGLRLRTGAIPSQAFRQAEWSQAVPGEARPIMSEARRGS